MDISKIIDDTMTKCIYDVVDGKFKEELNIDSEDEKLFAKVKQNRLLMNYCNELLKAYHKELSIVLATHGIKI